MVVRGLALYAGSPGVKSPEPHKLIFMVVIIYHHSIMDVEAEESRSSLATYALRPT